MSLNITFPTKIEKNGKTSGSFSLTLDRVVTRGSSGEPQSVELRLVRFLLALVSKTYLPSF